MGRTRDAVLAEVEAVLPKKPDVIEWRVDFFEALADTAQVIETARAVRDRAGRYAVMFTRRSSMEGGERIELAEPGSCSATWTSARPPRRPDRLRNRNDA